MIKLFASLLLISVLTLSILTPSVRSFIDDDCTTVLVENNEEDSEEKEIETSDNEESEEEKSAQFFYKSLHFDESFVFNDVINIRVFIDLIATPALEIKLPPPENFI